MPLRPFHLISIPAITLLAVLASGSAIAGDVGPEVAKRLLGEKRILPLSAIVDAVKGQMPGEMIEVELELEDGAYVYELKLLDPSGKVREIEADAATGKVLKVEDDD